MDPPKEDGPDASSLKPVSSLRARFENMNKANDVTPAAPSRTASPVVTLGTVPLSPNPRPDRPPEQQPTVVTIRKEAPPPPIKLKTKPPLPPHHSTAAGAGLNSNSPTSSSLALAPPTLPSATNPRSAGRILPAAPLSTSTQQGSKAPSVLVQAPLSPPQARVLNAALNEQHSYLNPDSVAATTPTSPFPNIRNFQGPSRSQTPTVDSRSPSRAAGSRPPSPPPPRRSGEIRRAVESKPTPLPPPVNRAEKPPIPARNSFLPDPAQTAALKDIADSRSPFNSPPGSGSSTDQDEPRQHEPPRMPARPQPKPEPQHMPPHASPFDPPPLHPSIVNRRKEQEMNGFAKHGIAPQRTGNQPPQLPARTGTGLEPPSNRPGPTSPGVPPPRPPRLPPPTCRLPPMNGPASVDPSMAGTPPPPKRVMSGPAPEPTPPQLPTRSAHGRSQTVDKFSDRAPRNIRVPPSSFASNVQDGQRPPEPVQTSPSLPDISCINRREPRLRMGVHQIQSGTETRVLDVSSHYVATTTVTQTRVWSLIDGELLLFVDHTQFPLSRGTAVKFKPGTCLEDEGARIWVGDSMGHLVEFDIANQAMVHMNTTAHTKETASAPKKTKEGMRLQDPEITAIHRHYNELWTLDSHGTLQVWGPDSTGVPNLANPPHLRRWFTDEHTFSMVVDDEFWYCTGKKIGVCQPTWEPSKPLKWIIQGVGQDGAGEICSGTTLHSQGKKVFLGHTDGKVSVYSRKDYSCLAVMTVGAYKINSMAGVGDHIWAAYSSGRICVYDVVSTPWVVKKDWVAHESAVLKIVPDLSSFFSIDQSRVLSLAGDGDIKTWDGLLQDDWLESQMRAREVEYCSFEKINALVMTWNAGASTPFSLNQDADDARFFPELLKSSNAPEILVFGFQELVDLEDKSAAAKRWMKIGSKKSKKTETVQERMSHQYRNWRDFLLKSLDDYMPADSLYHLLHCATMVGLFTCVFVKSTIRDRITNLAATEVKRGMRGYDGNKGAIMIRFMIDNSSLCFVNCHLAAGQNQTTDRHKDVAKIMGAQVLPREANPDSRIDSYVGGGDGTMILDHELCILNGDLNYRIDTMSRDTVVIAVKGNNLQKLLDRDQLLLTRRRNVVFELRAFKEMPISFKPTYKYDVGTDNYDTSEKKRSPAWCDRLLYRAQKGKIQQKDYDRWEVRVSDHRPVTGGFGLQVKRVEGRERQRVWIECLRCFEQYKDGVGGRQRVWYLTRVLGFGEGEAREVVGERGGKGKRGVGVGQVTSGMGE